MQYSDLEKFIRIKRKELIVSLNKFAQDADVACTILCRIENGKHGTKIGILEKIAKN